MLTENRNCLIMMIHKCLLRYRKKIAGNTELIVGETWWELGYDASRTKVAVTSVKLPSSVRREQIILMFTSLLIYLPSDWLTMLYAASFPNYAYGIVFLFLHESDDVSQS